MKLKILLLSIIISNNTFCQDLIIKRDSSKIFCKIIKEDSLSLYYIPSKNNQKTELSINKSEVLKYHSSLAVAKTNRNKLDTASKIYNAKILIKGFYKSYAEYISNSPSLAKEVIAVKRTSGDLILMHGSDYGYSLNGQTTNLGEYYGFCDGNNVYINYDHPRGYCKMEYIGPYTFFTYVVHGAGVFALIPDQLMVIDESGKFKDVTVKFVKKLLKEKYPELSLKYESEPSPKEKRKEYLIKLNDYLISKKNN